MEQEKQKAWFENHLRKTLNGLYDPSVLLNTPLPQLFNLLNRGNTASALRRLVTEAIESLRPTKATPLDSQTWRVYQILRRRYIEQLTQQQVASDMGLSVRQLQRNEKLAREVLTDYLWSTYNLSELVEEFMDNQTSSGRDLGNPPSMAQELEWLKDSVPSQSVSITSVLDDVIDVLDPLMHNSSIKTVLTIEENLPAIHVKLPLLRQALLSILNTAVQYSIAHSTVNIRVFSLERELHVHIKAFFLENSEPISCAEFTESVNMVQRLIELCQGQITINHGSDSEKETEANVLKVHIILPSETSVDILVVDDNADVLQLYQRYLVGTRYRYQGIQYPQQVLKFATEMQPGVVLLDVMMPGQDGWSLLSQLREHPKTKHIPVIVCSILSQEQFAHALGAADFIRKPVTRQAFLEALDRQLAPQPIKSD